jgi:NADH-ubiquinone oxidoreductase chain 5
MYLALLALPLSTWLCLTLFGRTLGARGTIVLSLFSGFTCTIISFLIFYEVGLCRCPCHLDSISYLTSELIDVSWGFLFDSLTAVMCLVVTLISTLVIIFSCSYMIEDPHFIRFISYLKVFTVTMLILVTANNYVQLFIGWEGVGLTSFLLISFWFNRLQAIKAAIQAMLVNKIGDVSLILGIAALYFNYKTTHYEVLFCTNDFHLDIACLLLTIGAVGKSGQLGLHIWLPNAMNAPTPVSALLHAATMVTAGVFLLARSSPIFEHANNAASVVVIIGSITSFAAGTMGLVQQDFKTIIAYSTCSQLGLMMAICGLFNYSLAIFHLFNHAFFKALLFLTAGVLIHALSNEQDIRKFANLQQTFLFSYSILFIAILALIGTPFLSGFYSKDVILELACASYGLVGHFAYSLIAFSFFITSFYSFKLLFSVFFSSKLTNLHKNNAVLMHDADPIMVFVLILLALGSLFSGWSFRTMFIGLGTDFWNNSLTQNSLLVEAEFLSLQVKLMPFVFLLAGAIFAFLNQTQTQTQTQTLFLFLYHRWFFDKFINSVFTLPTFKLGFDFVKLFDKGLFELFPFLGLGLSRNIKKLYLKLESIQNGFIYNYAILMVISTLCAFIVLIVPTIFFPLDYTLVFLMFVCLIVEDFEI